MATINTNITNSIADNKSFALLRTNPKLTSNVKLLVDSTDNLFLSSFRANKELSKVEYQKYAITPSNRYSDDLAMFYRGLPSAQKYQTLRKYSDVAVFSTYRYQYEDQYQYGAIHNASKLYDEQYKIFAPIWLDKKIPTKFVIYRVEDVDYKDAYGENNVGQTGRILELLNNATIVKTFDISINSNLGKYLNNHVNDKNFPEGTITTNFKEGEQSTFNGIDLINGGFAKKAEQFDEYYTQVDYPEIFSNQIITQGFERNQLAVANIINLEFLFDDYGAEDYKIYRYFGVYADEKTEGYFKSEGLTSNGVLNVKSSTYETVYDLDTPGSTFTALDMFPNNTEFNIPQLRWVKDKNSDFYNVKGSTTDPNFRLLISNNGVGRDKFEGYAKNGKKIFYSYKKPNYRGFIKFTVTDVPSTNDILFIGDKGEIGISNYSLSDYLLIADDTVPAGKANGNRFSNQGSLQQITIAISSAIKQGEIVTYDTTVDGTSVIVEDIAAGYQRRQTAFGVYSLNFSAFITIDYADSNNIGLVDSLVPAGISTVFSDWNIYTPIGGAVEKQSVLVESKEIGNITVGEFVKTKNSEVFITIDAIVKDPYLEEMYRVITNRPVNISNDNLFELYEIYTVSHGLFAAYDFKDFDFDFYSERNSNIGDLLLEQPVGSPNRELDTFYAGLTGILKQETISESTTQTSISNEYNRLNENELKETSTLSRVVPTICKFRLVNASNARNLPYILNVNEAFGEDNLSPNIEIDSDRKVEFLNMEHFHINTIPDYLYANGHTLENYLDCTGVYGVTMDELKDTNFNYFERYFNRNGYYDNSVGMWIDNTYTIMWSKFDKGNTEKNSSTVFRGLRYTYLERKEREKVSPTEFVADSNINDYKFGVVLSYNNGQLPDGTPITKNSIEFTSIKNDKFKFICIVISVNMVLNLTTNLDRYLLYTLEDITDSSGVIDTNVPFFIDFGSSPPDPIDPNAEFTLEAHSSAILNGSAKFTEYITTNKLGEYSWLYFQVLGATYAVKVRSVVDDEKIIVQGWPWEFNVVTGEPVSPINRLDPVNFGLIQINSAFTYYNGGENGFGIILNEANAYRMARRFNQYGDVNYITVNTDGTEILNDYVLSIESGVDIIKPSLTLPSADPDRPRAYQLSSEKIGSVITKRDDGGYITLLRRMNGNYNPLFNPVITFSDPYTINKVIPDAGIGNLKEYIKYNKFNDASIMFDSYKLDGDSYGYIDNYFFHKVNDEDSNNVLKLSQTTDKLPLYPKIGEVAIDKKKINMFKSKYSSDYFTKSLAASRFELVYGTLSPIEKKNFMTSTIMKVKDTYDITRYTDTSEASIEELDKIRNNASNTQSIHWYEDDLQVVADVYLPSAILSELLEDGIFNKFKKYIDVENSFGDKQTLLDDLDVYVKNNISTRFIIDLISIYGIEEKSIQTEFISTDDVEGLTDGGFKQLTNYNIQSYQNDGLSFRLIYNKRNGYSYKFKIYVKIQA